MCCTFLVEKYQILIRGQSGYKITINFLFSIIPIAFIHKTMFLLTYIGHQTLEQFIMLVKINFFCEYTDIKYCALIFFGCSTKIYRDCINFTFYCKEEKHATAKWCCILI